MSNDPLYHRVAVRIELLANTLNRCIFTHQGLMILLTEDKHCPRFKERTLYDALAFLIERGVLFVPQKDIVLVQLFVYLPVFNIQLADSILELEHDQRKQFS